MHWCILLMMDCLWLFVLVFFHNVVFFLKSHFLNLKFLFHLTKTLMKLKLLPSEAIFKNLFYSVYQSCWRCSPPKKTTLPFRPCHLLDRFSFQLPWLMSLSHLIRHPPTGNVSPPKGTALGDFLREKSWILHNPLKIGGVSLRNADMETTQNP